MYDILFYVLVAAYGHVRGLFMTMSSRGAGAQNVTERPTCWGFETQRRALPRHHSEEMKLLYIFSFRPSWCSGSRV